MENSKAILSFAGETAAFIVWGSTAYGYTNIGFSIAMIIFALYAIYLFLKEKKVNQIRIPRFMGLAMIILYGVLLVASLFHLENMKNLYGGYFSALGFILYTLPMWMILYVGWDKDIRKIICITIFVILYAMCIYGLYRYFAFHEPRLRSFYHFPTRIGMMLDMFIPFTAAIGWYYKEYKNWKIASIVLLILEFFTIVFCKTRGSYMAISVALLVVGLLLIVKYKNRLSFKQKCVIGGLIAAFIVFSVSYSVITRYGNYEAMRGGERFLMWETSYHMFLDHPVAGIGLDEWQEAYAEGSYHPIESREAGQIMPHNVFVYFFSTAGLLGGGGYLLYVAFMFVALVLGVFDKKSGPFSWAMLFMFTAATVHGLVDQTFILKMTGRMYYLLLGVGLLFERYNHRIRN